MSRNVFRIESTISTTVLLSGLVRSGMKNKNSCSNAIRVHVSYRIDVSVYMADA